MALEMESDNPGAKRGFHEIPENSEGPSRAGLHLRHDADGGGRGRGAVRRGPDDGAGHGGASHHEAGAPVTALYTMADSLPGLGIVAAVLGVVITMGALGGPPEEIGHKVAAALVGTFLGILLCYGLVGPIAAEHGQGHGRGTRLLSRDARGDRGVHKGGAAERGGESSDDARFRAHVRPKFQELEDLHQESRCSDRRAAAAEPVAPAA